MMKKILFFLTALFCSMTTFAAVDIINFNSLQEESEYHQLTQELRCPQCQNNNIADSNATIAVDMRAKVLELLQEGKSKQDVVNYMVERYGNFVTYDPPLTIATISLWLAPLLLLLGGIILVFRRKPVGTKLTKNVVDSNEDALNEVQLSEIERQRLAMLLKEKE